MKRKVIGLWASVYLVTVCLMMALPVWAQDDAPEGVPLAGDWLEIVVESDASDCFGGGGESTSSDEEVEAEDVIVTFGVYDDGETMLGVRGLEDFLYTRSADGTYEGSFLAILSEGYEYHATLTVESPTEMSVVSETVIFDCTASATVRYERLEGDGGQLWTETAREVTNHSFFDECLDVTLISLPVWVRLPDFLVAVRFDEDNGLAYYNGAEYEGGGGSFTRVEDTSDDPYLPTVVTYTLEVVGDDALVHSMASIAYEREDCQIAYTGTLVPFDGDIEALTTTIEETLAAEETP
jgi:hypothetical protein